MRKQVKKQKTS